jgi:hypothetical protein
MLMRAIAAFVALPGIVAFALPIAIGISTGFPPQHAALAAVPLGCSPIVVRARILHCGTRYVGTLGSASAPGNHRPVSDFPKPHVLWGCYNSAGMVFALGLAHSGHLHCARFGRIPSSRCFV